MCLYARTFNPLRLSDLQVAKAKKINCKLQSSVQAAMSNSTKKLTNTVTQQLHLH